MPNIPAPILTTLASLHRSPAQLSAELEEINVWLQEHLAQTGASGYIIGLSGGLDSALTATLAVRAVGPQRVTLISMPYGRQAPSLFQASTVASVDDAATLARSLPGVTFEIQDIAPTVDAEATSTGLAQDLGQDPQAQRLTVCLGNLKARTRAVRLRYHANRHSGLVLGTENLTEHWLGYFTIGGDEESDLEILSGFLKTEVRALAYLAGVPEVLITKAPSADLWAGQTDELELGLTYPEADMTLGHADWHHIDSIAPFATQNAIARGISSQVIDKVIARVRATGFKRIDKPTFRPTL